MLFQSMFGDDEAVCNLLSLCPTRWAVRTRAISRVVSSHTALLQTLKMLEQDKTVRGYSGKKGKCEGGTGVCECATTTHAWTEAIVTDVGEQQWRREFYEALDLVTTELDRRFDQEGLQVAALREQTVINAANGEYSGMREITAAQVPDQFDKSRLHMQLTLLGNLSKTKGLKTAQDVAGFIGALHPQTRELLTDVEKLIELCLCLPVSAASSERSFSTLRRLKTWLRSNMTQRRLTHLALMHVVHSDILDRMDIQPLMKRFIDNTPERKSTFGHRRMEIRVSVQRCPAVMQSLHSLSLAGVAACWIRYFPTCCLKSTKPGSLSGQYKFKCPALKDGTLKKCDKEWSYQRCAGWQC
ncbi:hypothetical protein F7725_004607 [Dissostichus mawsoni]|uniref:HAT C-terminal dimerisation domain-containing protein n=1 Tax=Dissostichus mawsoni TaxID=36200 RepID=A0A7J5XJY1_DISMA|nr:hypothetical protein F7725_004607 [Dissostichus mawsoni]